MHIINGIDNRFIIIITSILIDNIIMAKIMLQY